MEILEVQEVMTTAWWLVAGIIGLVITVGWCLISAIEDCYVLSVTFAFLAICCLLVVILTPHEVPTGKMNYTIEITDNEVFQNLIDKGYSFTRLYEAKPIYEVIGDILE